MRFLSAFLDALAGFVQRNPLTVLLVLVLALGAPALLKGIAVFILYVFMGLLLLVLLGVVLFRWRIRKMQRQMEEQFGQGFGRQQQGYGSPFGSSFGRQRAARQEREGEVRVHKTSETPEKRVSSDVGDYVDFEETKDPKK